MQTALQKDFANEKIYCSSLSETLIRSPNLSKINFDVPPALSGLSVAAEFVRDLKGATIWDSG